MIQFRFAVTSVISDSGFYGYKGRLINLDHIRINSNKLPIARLLPKNMLTSTTASVCNVNGTGKN